MLRSMTELKGYTIGATDGEIGHVSDLFFDDVGWAIRYLVVETGSWLLTRKVLISPYSLLPADWEHKRLPVRITREAVKNSPDIDANQPVSRQHEMQYADYYGYPYYWGGDSLWGDGMYEPMMQPPDLEAQSKARANGVIAPAYAPAERMQHQIDDPHLRSCQAVVGYHIEAVDGDIGHLQGMLVDESTWAIRYMVVDTSNWWGGHQVLIAPNWISAIRWDDSKVAVSLTQQAIKDSPRFDSSAELNRQLETDLYHHYARPGYWEGEPGRTPDKH